MQTSRGERPGSPGALRGANEARIRSFLQQSGGASQAEIARATGLAPATVSNIVRDLIASNALDAAGTGRGRRISVPHRAGIAIGIDIGHRHITVLAAGLDHEVLAEHRADLAPKAPAEEALALAGRLLDTCLRDADTDRRAVVGAGMGLPAPIDRASGQVGAPSILPGWVGVHAAELASERLGLDILVDNDANLGVLAEHVFGAGRGIDDLAYIKLSEGVGAGLIHDGELFRGRDGTAGEIGHTTIDEFGAVCRCGNRGCLETIVAARAVVDLLEPLHGPGLSIADIVAMAKDGVPSCERVLADTGRHTGVAVANLCNVFNPELILIGGELALAGEFLLAPMREVVRRSGIPSATRTVRITTASLGARVSALGAVALALRSAAEPGALRLA